MTRLISAMDPPVATSSLSANHLQILYVEDNADDTTLLKRLLEKCETPFELICTPSVDQAREKLEHHKVDVILLDLSLPDAQGLETVSRMKGIAPEVPIIVLTGHKDDALGIQCVQAGAQDYLIKGQIDGALLRRVLRYAIERQRTMDLARI